MAPDTGTIYRGPEVEQALARGETLVPLTEREADLMELEFSNRAERRKAARQAGIFKRPRLK